jgi:5-methylcytosine-specific restriction enzyme subunit McrC
MRLVAVDDLVAAVGVSFLAAANRAPAAGVLQGYRVTDEALPVLRGRLRDADQLRGRLGQAMSLEVRNDDYTVDILKNQ